MERTKELVNYYIPKTSRRKLELLAVANSRNLSNMITVLIEQAYNQAVKRGEIFKQETTQEVAQEV